jgi:hypothetical protein
VKTREREERACAEERAEGKIRKNLETEHKAAIRHLLMFVFTVLAHPSRDATQFYSHGPANV